MEPVKAFEKYRNAKMGVSKSMADLPRNKQVTQVKRRNSLRDGLLSPDLIGKQTNK